MSRLTRRRFAAFMSLPSGHALSRATQTLLHPPVAIFTSICRWSRRFESGFLGICRVRMFWDCQRFLSIISRQTSIASSCRNLAEHTRVWYDHAAPNVCCLGRESHNLWLGTVHAVQPTFNSESRHPICFHHQPYCLGGRRHENYHNQNYSWSCFVGSVVRGFYLADIWGFPHFPDRKCRMGWRVKDDFRVLAELPNMPTGYINS